MTFFGAMSLLVGVLSISEGRPRSRFMAADTALVPDLAPEHDPNRSSDRLVDPLFDLDVPFDAGRWDGIVIHHAGRSYTTEALLDSRHRRLGSVDGIAFHFLIGDGSGVDEGVIVLTSRWDDQRAGVHVPGVLGADHNQRSIAICLEGNGNLRNFSRRQMDSLVQLVRRLQDACGIPADRVRLARDVAVRSGIEDAGEVTSPGDFFPTVRFREQLRR